MAPGAAHSSAVSSFPRGDIPLVPSKQGMLQSSPGHVWEVLSLSQ